MYLSENLCIFVTLNKMCARHLTFKTYCPLLVRLCSHHILNTWGILFIMKQEIWKDVVGYEDFYQVSNMGNVRSKDTYVDGMLVKGKILTLYHDTKGYLFVWLNNGIENKMHRVHRLVAIAFIKRKEDKDFIDHINTVKDDNRVENLRWCTRSENMRNPITRNLLKESAIGNQKWLGKHHTEETKKKISESKKGKKNPNLWNSISDENKKKILNAAIEKNRVEIEQFSLDGKLIKVWDSMVEAARSLGVWNTNIHKCCNGQAKTCGGFIWKYHNKNK